MAPLIVLATAAASLLALYFGLRRIVRPLHALGRQASRLAWGDFEAIRQPVGGIDEIHELQRTLQEMAGQIRRSQAAMQDYIAALTEMQEVGLLGMYERATRLGGHFSVRSAPATGARIIAFLPG